MLVVFPCIKNLNKSVKIRSKDSLKSLEIGSVQKILNKKSNLTSKSKSEMSKFKGNLVNGRNLIPVRMVNDDEETKKIKNKVK